MSVEAITVASVQPRTGSDPDPRDNTLRVGKLVSQAAAGGAELVVFPEGFPGPLRHTQTYDAEPEIAKIAATNSCGICWSRIEQDDLGRWFVVAYLHDRDGNRVGRYVRAHPATGDVHASLSGVGLDPGDELVVADFHGLPVGLLICSELWLPEVARVLAIRGAELLLAPAGGGFGAVGENWQLIARARAIEDECYVAMTSHRFGDERGFAVIAGPEGLLAESATEEVISARCDLERLRWLRSTDDSMVSPKPFTALPGTLRARRPELYEELTRQTEDLFDYSKPEQIPARR
ncbi:MAG: carbon-nitrogen hydrolase family protein [Actinobacteria bacterium]|nr:carbon-nitrogen hydrolase family protein [Actinomycetota bacterium]